MSALPSATEPEEVADGVVRVGDDVHALVLPLPDEGLKAANVYAVRHAEGFLLVDSGWSSEESSAALRQGLAAVGATLDDVTHVLTTHMHRDHYPHAVVLRRVHGFEVGLSAGEEPSLTATREARVAPLEAQLRQLAWSGAEELTAAVRRFAATVEVDRTEWEEPDRWLQGGRLEDLDLEVLPTPGHTAGHVCFDDPARRLLFAGDHVLPHITPSIGFDPVPTELPLGDYLTSLALVRERPDRVLLPGHGPVGGSVHARVDELVAHHDVRLQECLTAVRGGAGTAAEVARILRWTRHARRLDDLNVFNAMLAVCETLAHLRLLVAQNRLAVDRGSGAWQFSLLGG